MTWLRAVGQLSRSGPSEVADAHLHLRDLVGMARALRPGLEPGHPCGGPGCPFRGHVEAGALCGLVRRLAALDVVALSVRDVTEPQLVDTFVTAVADAADTVRWCRQTAHQGGACWFASPGGEDCGEILKLAHRLN